MAPVLGYWKIRGLAQHIRLLLEYTGTEFEDRYYAPESWPNVKFTLGLDLPNLPFYIDGNTKITQSNAIVYHIGRKHNMIGTTEHEKIQVDMLVNQVGDMRSAFVKLCYLTYDTKKDQYLEEDLPPNLKKLSDYLGSKTWFLGEQITVADFMIYEILDVNLKICNKCLDSFKNLKDFHKRFEELPAMKKYMCSSRFIKIPICGPKAIFGNK